MAAGDLCYQKNGTALAYSKSGTGALIYKKTKQAAETTITVRTTIYYYICKAYRKQHSVTFTYTTSGLSGAVITTSGTYATIRITVPVDTSGTLTIKATCSTECADPRSRDYYKGVVCTGSTDGETPIGAVTKWVDVATAPSQTWSANFTEGVLTSIT